MVPAAAIRAAAWLRTRGRRALWRCAVLLVAVAFAASVPGRPSAALAMAIQGSGHVSGQAMDCAGHSHAPSHAGMPGGMCCTCCGPTCESCGAPMAPPLSRALLPAAPAAPPVVPVPVAVPTAGIQFRQPLPIGPPSAPVA